MTFIDTYESQLVEAGYRRRDARLRNRAARLLRLPRGRGAAVALAALVVGVPAAAATVAAWDPFADSNATARFAAPSRSQGALDPGLSATLGVLRRPQTDEDRGAATSRTASAFRLPGYRGVNLEGIRVVDRKRGIVLVPFERIPAPSDSRGRPLPGIDPATYSNAVCFFERTSDGFGANACHTARKIKIGRALGTADGALTGLVPDGVARVVLRRGDESTEATVRNNFFAANGGPPTQVDWLDADGALVKRIDLTAPPPRP